MTVKKGDQAVCYIFPTSDKVGHDNNRLGRNGIQNMILGEKGKICREKVEESILRELPILKLGREMKS